MPAAVFFHAIARVNGTTSILSEPFLSGLQKMGVQLLWDAEIFHPHAVFISQNMLDRIMRICKNFLKLGFFGHILFLLFQNMSSYI